MHYPVSDQIAGAGFLINVTAVDYNVDKIWYNCSNHIVFLNNSEEILLPSYIWDTIPGGWFDIQFYANDTTGNLNDSIVIDMFKDNFAPQIEILSPYEDSYHSGRPSIHVNVTDNSNIDKIWYTVWFTDKNEFLENDTQELLNDTLFNWAGRPEGLHQIWFSANDTWGNTNSSVWVTFYKDTFAPNITIEDPINFQNCSSAPWIEVSAVDAFIVDKIWYNVGPAIVFLSNGIPQQLTTAIWFSLGEGPFNIEFHANDSAGNLNDTFTYTLIKDTIKPWFNINSPANNSAQWPDSDGWIDGNKGNMSITIYEENYYNFWYRIGESAPFRNESLKDVNNTYFQINEGDWDSHPNGTVKIYFWAEDWAGNINVTILYVNKSSAKPNIFVYSPVYDSIFNGTCPTFDFEFIGGGGGDDRVWVQNGTNGMNSTMYSYAGANGDHSLINGNFSNWYAQWQDGSVEFIFWANNTAGTTKVFWYIEKDTTPPDLQIWELINGTFQSSPPNFQLYCNEKNWGALGSIYYIVGNNDTKHFLANQLLQSGVINSKDWYFEVDGNVTITFYANDTVGNEITKQVKVIKDSIKPVLTINSPNFLDAFSNNAPDFEILINDANYNISWYAIDKGFGFGSNYLTIGNGTIDSSAWNLPDVNGHFFIRFWCNDSAGNEVVTYAEVEVIRDNNIPTVAINIPMDGAYNSLPVYNLTLDGTGSNVSWIWMTYSEFGSTKYFLGSGKNFINGTFGAEFWNLPEKESINVYFHCNDSAGREGSSVVVSISKDTWAPRITNVEYGLKSGTNFNSPFRFELYFDETVTFFKYSINGIDFLNTATPFSLVSDIIDNATFNGLSEGSFSLKFYYNDSLGNTNYTAFTMYKDTVSPSFQIVGLNFNDLSLISFWDPPTIIIRIPDYLMRLEIRIRDQYEDGTYGPQIAGGFNTTNRFNEYWDIAAGNYSLKIDQDLWDQLPSGNITFELVLYDAAGNVYSASFDIIKLGGGPGDEFDPMFFLFIIIGAVAAVSVTSLVVVTKRSKKKLQQVQEAAALPKKKLDIDASRYQIRKEGIQPGKPIVGKKAGKKKKIGDEKPEKKRVLTAEEKAAIAQTESEMAVEKTKHICIVHKGAIKGAMYLCPECDTLYCMDCAKALRVKGEKCWACEAEIDLVITESEKVSDVPDNARDILLDLIKYDNGLQNAMNMELPFDQVPEIDDIDFTLINIEMLDIIDTFEWPFLKKQQFIKDLLALTPAEREILLREIQDFQVNKQEEDFENVDNS